MSGNHEPGIIQTSLDILPLQLFMLLKDLLGGHSRTQHINDDLIRSAHAAYTRFAVADLRIDGNAVEVSAFHVDASYISCKVLHQSVAIR